ncbi:MAG TPA: phosphoglycerate mutase [Anaerolineaceae bacterium]|nr:phosphoglycerate mutase [Anaerolineaceae bacterium]
MDLDFLRRMTIPAKTKIVMLILDGLGGLPMQPGGLTELETANTPNLDKLASLSALGLTVPAAYGITPGSGPGHLGIFGYDPIQHEIGRGALEALGVDFDLRPDDIAARGNFCLLDDKGVLVDRRAGRLATIEAKKIAAILNTIKMDGVEFFVEPVKEHRFAFVIRGAGLGANVSETDPQKNGVKPLLTQGMDDASIRTAEIVNQFINKATNALAGEKHANGILLRGFDKLPVIPTYQEIFKLNPAAIAVNGMYKGVSRLIGMEIIQFQGTSIEDEFAALEQNWQNFDFFYIHVKQTDTAGEDGDFDRKVKVIEEVDALIPRLTALNPDVVIVSGDHSSPAALKFHSWHPVPTLLFSNYVRPDGISSFGERNCLKGSLGILPAKEVMPIALANAFRLAKYGA